MKNMHATVVWSGDLRFTGQPSSGHPVPMDAALSVGGGDTAVRPLELLLLGLGGCTGMDVISILGKMRRTVTSLEVALEAEQDEEHPRKLRSVKVTYRIKGKNLDEESVRRAISLSEETYCSVAATFRFPVALSWNLELGRD